MDSQPLTILEKVKNFARENREILIRVGGVVAGAALGATVTALVIRAQEDAFVSAMLADEAAELTEELPQ